jgi:uncharacterized protein with GYD domain
MEGTMLFSLRAQYTADSLRALIQNPIDRSKAIGTALQAVSGKLLNCYSTSGGDQQGVLIIYEVPDGTSQLAFTNAITASNAVRNIESQRLYTPEETVDSLRKAQGIDKAYEPPTGRRG